MTDWFFYQERGQTVGPLAGEEMRQRVRDGSLRAFDLIYKEGESGWKMAMEHADLREAFRESGQNVMKGRPWVCLRRKGEDSFDFVTDGPFSDDEIRTALSSGRLGYSDYLWRNEYTEWRRIGGIEDFNPRVAKQKKTKVTKEPSAEDLLENVVKLRRGDPNERVVTPPAEAAGEDLAEVPTLKRPKPPTAAETKRILKRDLPPPEITKKGTQPPPPPAEDAGPAIFVEKRKRSRKVKPAWADLGIVAGLAVALIGLISFYLVRHSRVTPVEVVTTAPVVAPVETEAPPEATAPAEPAAPTALDHAAERLPKVNAAPALAGEGTGDHDDKVADAAPVPAPSRVPTDLKLSITTSASGRSRVDVRANGTKDIPVYVLIVGAPGQVADAPAYYRYLKVKSTGGMGVPIDLPDVELGPGRYRVAAETGDLRREKVFSPGVNDPKFKAAAARQRKLAQAAWWTERLNLYRTSQQVLRLFDKASVGKKLAGAGPPALDKLKKQNGGAYLYYDDWAELKAIVAEGRARVTPELIARSKRARERVVSMNLTRP